MKIYIIILWGVSGIAQLVTVQILMTIYLMNMKRRILKYCLIWTHIKIVFDLPIASGKHLRRISDRTALQSADNAEKFITTRKIDSFESLAKFTADREQKYSQLGTVHLPKGQKLSRLKELSKMYALLADQDRHRISVCGSYQLQ